MCLIEFLISASKKFGTQIQKNVFLEFGRQIFSKSKIVLVTSGRNSTDYFTRSSKMSCKNIEKCRRCDFGEVVRVKNANRDVVSFVHFKGFLFIKYTFHGIFRNIKDISFNAAYQINMLSLTNITIRLRYEPNKAYMPVYC